MENGSRKASDLLLEMENKIETLLHLVRSQDLNIKVLSNKLNSLYEKLDNLNVKQADLPKIEAVDTPLPVSTIFGDRQMDNRQVMIQASNSIPVEQVPQGFRRTSRPETYAGDDAYLPNNQEQFVEKEAEVVVNKKPPVKEKPKKKENVNPPDAPTIPVQQRMVDKNGKSLFLADIEVLNHETGEVIYKTRTNGAGKWMAALVPGKYKVKLKKREALTKEQVDVVQDIVIDGTQSPLELPMVIVK